MTSVLRVLPMAALIAVCSMQSAGGQTEVVYLQVSANLINLPADLSVNPLASNATLAVWSGDTSAYIDSTLLPVLRQDSVSSIAHAFNAATRSRVVLNADGTTQDWSFMNDWMRVELPAARVDSFINTIAARKLGYAEPQYGVVFDADPTGERTPSDTLWPRQSGYLNLHRMSTAWAKTTGSSAIKVAVLDGGMWWHSDFAGRNFYGYSRNGQGYKPWHGTCVASIIGAASDNTLLMTGGDWNCQIGNFPAYPDNQGDLSNLMAEAVQAGSQILNCSFGITGTGGYFVFSSIVQQAAATVTQAGSVIVASAGNQTCGYPGCELNYSWPEYPSSYDGLALRIGGTYLDKLLHRRSNYGYGTDFAAYADTFGIALSSDGTGYVSNFGGTSQATAIISSNVSILEAYGLQCGWPPFDIDDVTHLLKSSVPNRPATQDPGVGWGVPRLDSALRFLEFPNSLEKFTVTGGWTDESSLETVKVNLPDIPYAQYVATRHALTRTVAYPQPFYRISDVWANGRLSAGAIYATHAEGDYFGGTITSNQFAEVLSFDGTSCLVRTCWYDIPGHDVWPPTMTAGARAAVTVAGELLLEPVGVEADLVDSNRVYVRALTAYPRTAAGYNYHVKRESDPWSSFQSVPSTDPVAGVYYTDMPLGSTYYSFGVAPWNSNQHPGLGGTVTIQTAPNKPEDVRASTSSSDYLSLSKSVPSGDEVVAASADPSDSVLTTRVNVSWSPPLNQFRPPSQYRVEAWDGTLVAHVNVLSTSAALCLPLEQRTYAIRVLAYNEQGTGVAAPLVIVTTGCYRPDACGGGGCEPFPPVNKPGDIHTFSLGQNMPNPFNAGTLVRFSLPKEGEASLEVYNILGQKVATLSDGRLPAGNHEVQWSGMDDRGIALPSGLYMLRLASGGEVAHRKMVIMK